MQELFIYIYTSNAVDSLSYIFLEKKRNISNWDKLNNFHPRLLLSYAIYQVLMNYNFNQMIRVHNEFVAQWLLKRLHDNDLFNRPMPQTNNNAISINPTIVWKYTNQIIQWSENISNNHKVIINDMVYHSSKSDLDNPLRRFLEKYEYVVYIGLIFLCKDIKSISIDWIENDIIIKLNKYFNHIDCNNLLDFFYTNKNYLDNKSLWVLQSFYKSIDQNGKKIVKLSVDCKRYNFFWSYLYQLISQFIRSEKMIKRFEEEIIQQNFVGLFKNQTAKIKKTK